MQVQYIELNSKDITSKSSNLSDGPLKITALINYLENMKPGFKKILLEGNELKSDMKVILNGRNVEFIEGLMTPIREEDQISFFPPIGGG